MNMRLFPESGEDLLDAASLPPTDKTELNYRTRPLSSEHELQLTALVLFVPVPIVISLSAVAGWLIWLHPLFENLMLAMAVLLLVWLVVCRLTGASHRRAVVASVLFASAFIGSKTWDWAVDAGAWPCRVVILVAWVTSCLVARQVAAWILVGPQVDYETMRRWQVNLPRIVPHGLSLDCPELLTYSVSPLLLGPAWWCAAWLAANTLGCFWLWPFCFVGTLHAVWFTWHVVAFAFVPWPDLKRCWQVTGQAIVVFLTYNIYDTPAAGVFRFPTCWLRPFGQRWLLSICVLLLLAFCYAATCPQPSESFRERGIFVGQLLWNLALITVASPLVFAALLWFTAGSLLARFDSELSARRTDEVTEWDNYVDRIVNSGDDLEREHFFVGTSLVGDYPILVHREIQDQHMHIVGDTGASKTSLGIAPLATQMIARGDSTVVIVDLKGDKALFETCRREAARTGKLRFRWLANEVGKTTFGFNPFVQSHNQFLSVDQFVQQLLQGLSLDYGLKYGAGYFTAMNEIVLTNVLKNYNARSFRELDRYLRDQRLYARIGHAEDWAQARHLGALVSRLAGSEVINVVPGMYPDQPEVASQAIDALNVFEEPQVVYLWLRSAVEATNAPTIARLFLWAMFTAATHRRQGKHRVYFFLDEFQQIISDGIKLIFEQFRDMGGTIIAAHQTAGQLIRQGTDLAETVDSCTAVKQVYRASDPGSLDRLEKLAGNRREQTAVWYQPYERGTGDLIDRYDPIHAAEGRVRVQEVERPRLDRRKLLEIGSLRPASLIRFTFGSGYTQFAGATVPMISQYPITFEEYERRRAMAWPTAPGAFTVPAVSWPPPTAKAENCEPQASSQPKPQDFVQEFERRSRLPADARD